MMRICTFEEVDPNPPLLLIHRCRSLFPQTFRRPQPKILAIPRLTCALDPKRCRWTDGWLSRRLLGSLRKIIVRIKYCVVVWNAPVFLTEDAQVNLIAITLET